MKRRSHRQRAANAAAGGAALLLAVTACGSRPAGTGDQAAGFQPVASTSTSPAATITIDPSAGEGTGETFTPLPTGTPALTAAEAWAVDAQANSYASTAIPGDVTPQLGLLTLPVGPAGMPGTGNLAQSNGEAYTALNELTWAFSWQQCPVQRAPPERQVAPRPRAHQRAAASHGCS